MECFDISHNQGAETTGSMVVFEHGRPAKREYRKFKLRTTQGHADDFKSMAEVMIRRYGNEKIGLRRTSSSSMEDWGSSMLPFLPSVVPAVMHRLSDWLSELKKSM